MIPQPASAAEVSEVVAQGVCHLGQPIRARAGGGDRIRRSSADPDGNALEDHPEEPMARTSADPASRESGSRASAGKAKAASKRRGRSETLDSSPLRYIARVSVSTGHELDTPIDPGELLVHAHRDKHPVELAAQFMASRVIQYTGREQAVRRGLRAINSMGGWVGEAAGALTGSRAVEREAKKLMGVTERVSVFRFREPTPLSEKEVRARVEKLQRDARTALRNRGRNPRLQVLLTGATGFVGKEIICQAASDRRIAQVIAVVRPQTIRDRKTGKVLKLLRPQQRGSLLLKQLHIPRARANKFRFVEGDIEKPDLGIAPKELARLRKSVTHVIHCAASVSFDDTYENSYRANVLGCRNALEFSLGIQQAPGSSFIQHIAIETSYIHGRKKASMAQEDALRLPEALLQQLLRADQGDGLDRDRSLPDRQGPARRPAPAVDRDRRLADRQQSGRHQGGQRADQRLRTHQGGAAGGPGRCRPG